MVEKYVLTIPYSSTDFLIPNVVWNAIIISQV